jgi:multisubunit Na+/H+ antiporter MnhF subunit
VTGVLWSATVLLALILAAGLVRTAIGPSRSDRLSAAMILGTNGTAILLLLGVVMEMPALFDGALVLVLLAAVATATFVRVGRSQTQDTRGGNGAG